MNVLVIVVLVIRTQALDTQYRRGLREPTNGFGEITSGSHAFAMKMPADGIRKLGFPAGEAAIPGNGAWLAGWSLSNSSGPGADG
ncbi:hypothetical protein A1507_17505 [Methylomonas koyamae]|uniref:Uncharacterized protein n=1 Tax=Methylomonas koyamae TaxID=702114 RepID=A0A177N6Z4_9GAMM|nr:hypothetical protein A1507_17505 [Methylomonas koyamae]